LAGEQAARAHLEGLGYTLCAARWRCAAGEIDLIMRDRALLVFVEVRTRRSAESGAPFESITARKQAKLMAVAHTYLAENGLEDVPWRIDAVGVTVAGGRLTVEVIENAVGW
jgi:putative endonuclease